MWAFANDPATREAIHAEPISSIGAFDECTNGDRIRYRTLYDSVLNVHEELLEAGLQVLAYSGDHDAIVSHVGTEAWTSRLGCRILAPWAQWRLDDGTVGGFVVRYDGISYATVLGAGHAVPSSRPIAALTMLRRFVQHGRLDATAVGGVVKGGSATASQ